ncbi:Putative Tetratricopeptide TPR-1 [Penicillium brasilianum]|uniref:Putative Tetratricopeptide TPR-1 n=1 Tax=Penicillium brasilianum TaxID=104259 RepID=A0A0F7U2M3_PENBI|nr:Putative Tetratricopeptide TPR-1 [Penicillium brasilianum]
MYQRALVGYEKALGPDHTSTLDTVNNLSLLYPNQGKLKEAEEMYQRALGKLKEVEEMFQRALIGYEKSLGPDYTSTLDTVTNLGLLYSDHGKLKEAEEMYHRALVGYEEALGPDHRQTQQVLERLNALSIMNRI